MYLVVRRKKALVVERGLFVNFIYSMCAVREIERMKTKERPTLDYAEAFRNRSESGIVLQRRHRSSDSVLVMSLSHGL